MPDDVLPTFALGTVAAAVPGQEPPYRWRSVSAQFSTQDGMVWCYIAWVVTELLDDVMGAGRSRHGDYRLDKTTAHQLTTFTGSAM